MYRPLKFSEVIGQEIPVKLIKNGLIYKKLPKSIILHGSSGIGKTTLARLISAWFFCLNKEKEDVCSTCSMCLGIQSGGIPDVLEFDAASHTSVEDIREILELCNYSPQIGDYKIFIIDEAHMLSRNAIAALLKTLEEAKNNVIFILATTEIDKISSAIKSRCFCIPLQDLKKESIATNLMVTATKSAIEITKESVDLICEVSYGSMREALSIFSMASLLSSKIDVKILSSILCLANQAEIEQLAQLILNGQATLFYESLKTLIYEKNIVSISLLRQLIAYFKQTYTHSSDKNLVLKILIHLNKISSEALKTSLFNELVLILLSEIPYLISNNAL